MKMIIIMIMGWLVWLGGLAQTRSIIDINDKATTISSLQGKKIILIVLPLEKDTAIINQLLRFQQKFEKQVQVIGLVQTASRTKEFYKDAYDEVSTAGIMISEGILPAAEVADERESVIQWISGKNNNRQVDRYATGSKYFLSEDGRLYAQLGKGTSLDAPIVKNIVNTKVPISVTRKKEGTMPTPKL